MNRARIAAVVLAASLLMPVPAPASDDAVIIQAYLPAEAEGADWGDGYEGPKDELWNDCFLTYQMLWGRPGIDGDHDRIQMLWGRGQDGRRNYDDRYNPALVSALTITDDSACLATIEDALADAAQTVGSGDTLFCYTWGHGDHNGPEFAPWRASHFAVRVRPLHGIPRANLWDTALARMAEPVPGQRVFIMQQCFGGGFTDDLGDDRTTLVCASAAGKKTYSCDDDDRNGSPLPEHEVTEYGTWRHSEFNFHFLNALRGSSVAPYDSPTVVYADTSGDQKVSWFEAHRYNEDHNSQSDHPVYYAPQASWNPRAGVLQGESQKPPNYGAAMAAIEQQNNVTAL